jgi:phosphotransferase system HPr-like phosphotransfer protein
MSIKEKPDYIIGDLHLEGDCDLIDKEYSRTIQGEDKMNVYKARIEAKNNALNPPNCSHIVNAASNLSIYEGRIKYDNKEVDLQSILGLLSLAPIQFQYEIEVTIATIDSLTKGQAESIFNELEIGEVVHVQKLI